MLSDMVEASFPLPCGKLSARASPRTHETSKPALPRNQHAFPIHGNPTFRSLAGGWRRSPKLEDPTATSIAKTYAQTMATENDPQQRPPGSSAANGEDQVRRLWEDRQSNRTAVLMKSCSNRLKSRVPRRSLQRRHDAFVGYAYHDVRRCSLETVAIYPPRTMVSVPRRQSSAQKRSRAAMYPLSPSLASTLRKA